jgi:hypothetical protein
MGDAHVARSFVLTGDRLSYFSANLALDLGAGAAWRDGGLDPLWLTAGLQNALLPAGYDHLL